MLFLLSLTPPWGQFDQGSEQAVAAGYVIADLSLLALSCSLLRGADRRNPALLLIVGSLSASFISDSLMDGIVLADGWQWTSPDEHQQRRAGPVGCAGAVGTGPG